MKKLKIVKKCFNCVKETIFIMDDGRKLAGIYEVSRALTGTDGESEQGVFSQGVRFDLGRKSARGESVGRRM